MKNPAYSEKQLKIISGEIPLSSVNGYTALALYKKAIENGDTELAERAKERLDQLKEIAKQKNLDSVNKRNQLKRENEFQWKQPKGKEYTEHQKQIVRGDIPLSKVNTNELIHIHLKAKAAGDYELSERMYDLIISRREEAEERASKKSSSKDMNFNNYGYEDRTVLDDWEKKVINSEVDLDEITSDHLRHILKLVKETGDETKIKVVEQLIMYKERPESILITQDHDEAMDGIERLMGRPIRRPNTWFI